MNNNWSEIIEYLKQNPESELVYNVMGPRFFLDGSEVLLQLPYPTNLFCNDYIVNGEKVYGAMTLSIADSDSSQSD